MNKFDRVVSILILLQTKKVVRAQELADHFEVSIRTIYRDIRTLEQAGIPLFGEAGIGYSLVEGYSLPPVMFTEEEATSFIIAEKLVERMTGNEMNEQFGQAMAKIKAILRSAEKNKLDNLDKRVYVSPRLTAQPESSDKGLPLICNSITNKEILDISYEALYSGEITQRRIEPVGLFYYANHWHLIAYCQLRKAYRDFRIDRISVIRPTGVYIKKNHPNLKAYLETMENVADLSSVEVHFEQEVLPYAQTEKLYHGWVGEEKDNKGAKMRFLTPSLEGTARWLLIYTSHITIINPPELRDKMKSLTLELTKKYLKT